MLTFTGSLFQVNVCFDMQIAGMINPVVSTVSPRQRKALEDTYLGLNEALYASALAVAVFNQIRKYGNGDDPFAISPLSIAESLCLHFKHPSGLSNEEDIGHMKYEAFPCSNGFINFKYTGSGGPLVRSEPAGVKHANQMHSETSSSVSPSLDVQPGLDVINGHTSGCNKIERLVRRLEVKMIPAVFEQESFELYKRYQVSQHGDDPDMVFRMLYLTRVCVCIQIFQS